MGAKTAWITELAKEVMYKFPLYNDLFQYCRIFLDYEKNLLVFDMVN